MMLERFKNMLQQAVNRMLNKNSIESELGVKIAMPSEMASKITLWGRLFEDRAPWTQGDTRSMNLPASIASELARLITLEMNLELTGGARAEYLSEQLRPVLANLRRCCEYACAKGGIVFKPYIDGEDIAVDFVQADSFFPTAFNGRNEVTGAVFPELYQEGDLLYIRLERHELEGDRYRITNRAFKQRAPSNGVSGLGRPCPLAEVPEWAGLAESVELERVSKPLFGYFRMPAANTIDAASPLGVSAYSRAVNLIREADEQYSRLLWEFEGTELAIDADEVALKPDRKGGQRLPKKEERLFRLHGWPEKENGAPFYEVFSPQIRDQSYINGLNALLRKIEFLCGLAYGTLSDVQDVDKTAEEIKASKQRSYSTVRDAQKALETALKDLVYAMDVWATIGGLAPQGKVDLAFDWDDSLVTDRDKEFSQRMQLVSSGQLKPELNLAWYFGVSEKRAREMMPEAATLFGPPGGSGGGFA